MSANHEVTAAEPARSEISVRPAMAGHDSRPQAWLDGHGGTATFLIAAWIGMPVDAAGFVSFQVSSGSIITSLREDDYFHNRGVVHLNDTAHLTTKEG